MNKVYMVYTKVDSIFGGSRSLQGAYAARDGDEAKRMEILVSTRNGPDDVTIDEIEVNE